MFFFVKDLVDDKRITIEYCHTHKMIADVFTKPLQGRLFRTLRSVTLGRISVSEFMKNHPNMSASKERVGNWVITYEAGYTSQTLIFPSIYESTIFHNFPLYVWLLNRWMKFCLFSNVLFAVYFCKHVLNFCLLLVIWMWVKWDEKSSHSFKII